MPNIWLREWKRKNKKVAEEAITIIRIGEFIGSTQDVFRDRHYDNTRIPARQQQTLDTLRLHCKYNLTTLE